MAHAVDLPAPLERFRRLTPGLHYLLVGPGGRHREFTVGLADVRAGTALTPAMTLMACSMTKTFTAVALLQQVARGRLRLDDALDDFLPDTPYRGQAITLRHLLTHTAGLPNPLPLRWVHLAAEAAHFNETAALSAVLRQHPRLVARPGQRYGYSNIGYWLLGHVLTRVTRQPYTDYVQTQLLAPLGVPDSELGFRITDPRLTATGYLARFSLLNLGKGWVTDPKFWGTPEGRWVPVRPHYLNGPAFGGLLGSGRAFAAFLRDQLAPESALLDAATRPLLTTRQTTADGRPLPMTLGWHLRGQGEHAICFKEGAGGGFHSEMRLYPHAQLASVVLANSTGFPTTRFLDAMDAIYLHEPTSGRLRP